MWWIEMVIIEGVPMILGCQPWITLKHAPGISCLFHSFKQSVYTKCGLKTSYCRADSFRSKS